MGKKVIALDAGHGLKTAGKRCLKSLDKNQTREWYLNDRIMDLVQERLLPYDCTVLRVDDTTGEKDISLYSRVQSANKANSDIYISCHHNAGVNGMEGGGTVVYYYNDSKMREKANRLYRSVILRTSLVGNRSKKVDVGDFYVIRNTKMPALLLENGFMDSATDVPIILTKSHASNTARGIAEFIVSELELQQKKTGENDSCASGSDEYYPSYTGRKSTIAYALSDIGVDCSYSFRAKIAKANGISGYIGSAAQNTKMYNLLVAGILKKA